jgi:hypothetical protein
MVCIENGLLLTDFPADVGSSLIRESRKQQKSKNLQAVCSIAHSLLRLDETSEIRGTTELLAEDFTGCFGRATAVDLLRVSGPNRSLAANLPRLASFLTRYPGTVVSAFCKCPLPDRSITSPGKDDPGPRQVEDIGIFEGEHALFLSHGFLEFV